MPEFTVYNTHTGQIRCTGTQATVAWCMAQARPGESVYLGLAPAGTYILDGAPQPLPAKPSGAHVFDWTAHAWTDPRSINDIRAELKADLAHRRWERETGGLVLDSGLCVRTDRAERAALAEALANAHAQGLTTFDFKFDGRFASLTVEEGQEILEAISTHVQSCFTAERAHCDLLDATADRDVLLAYDASVFPELPSAPSAET